MHRIKKGLATMGSLNGLKILDFSTLLPGPYASLMLADLGAEVLRISSASKYDLVQDYGSRIEGTDISACQAWLGRNKKTMFLNLKTPQAKQIVRRLIMEYDIILEQFRPGVMQKLGLGFEELREINPRLIYCSLTGYGQTGPLRDAAGHDINYMSRSGIISHAGRAEEGPSLMNFQSADIAVGSLNSVIGILAAVYHREQTGQGQYVDIAMMDGCVPFNSLDGADFLVSGKQPAREGQLLNGGSMYDYYQTKDGGYMSVGSLEPKFWESFCRTLGREDLISGSVCPENVAEVKEQIPSAKTSSGYPSGKLMFDSSSFVDDCAIESDLEMYFPDTYVPGSSERMLLYRELDNIEDDRTLEAYRKRLEDRFGPVPTEGEELMQVVTLRRLGKQLGCEKIILRQGIMNMQFVSNAESPYYQSQAFSNVLNYATRELRRCQLKEVKGRRLLHVRDVPTVGVAVQVLKAMG